MDGFIGADGQPAPVQTVAYVYQDSDRLGFTVRCSEPNMGQLVAKCRTDDDGNIFSDDCLEIFISPKGSDTEYYHFVTNTLGTRWDEKGKGSPAWNAAWTSKVQREPDRWTAMIDIPSAAIGGPPQRGDVWWFNICRQRQPGGLQLSAWSATDSNFHDVSRFAAMVFDGAYVDYLRTRYLNPFDRLLGGLKARAQIRASAARRLDRTLAPVQASLQPLRAAIATAKPVPTDDFGVMLGTGQGALKQLATAEADLNEAVAGVEAARRMAQLARPGQEALVYATTAITDRRVLPTPEPPQKVSRNLTLRACRGEYEPVSLVVYALRNDLTVLPKASPLRGPGGTIPAEAIDIRGVKCWYQAGGNERFPINHNAHIMTPELLLRDDLLVRVDPYHKTNYLRLKYPDGQQKLLNISNPKPTAEESNAAVEAMPVRDADTLQPVRVPKQTAKQFWVTVHVPAEAKPGVYRGKIDVLAGDKTIETLPITLEVLPFDLAENPLESSIYFHWGITLDTTGQGTIGINKRTPAQLKAELINLREHGIDNPTVGVQFASGQLPDELRLRQEAGMRHDRLYYLVGYTAQLSPEQIKQIIDLARGFGYSEFYFYGNDEAQGDRLTEQRPAWEAVHAAGGKVFVAGSQGQNFPLVGDLQDLLVCYGDPSKEEAARWHSKGHKIFCYANPQGGIEAPETYRRNFGLLLAVSDYDGGMTYIYYSGSPSWNDYCIPPYRQHNFVYPTADGVIDTVQWEGYREGIDDLRYLGTLRKAIAEATAAGGKAAAEATQAQAYLDSLDVAGDLYAVRDDMIRWIERLQKLTGR